MFRKLLVTPFQRGFSRKFQTMGSINCKKSSTIDHETETNKMPASTQQEPNNDFVEGVVCKETDLNENEMKTFELGDHGKVLVVKQHGQFKAVGTKCSHYGAPLVTGSLGDGRVRCPWHGACFNLTTGDIEDFPGADSLPCYQVNVEKNGDVKVRARKTELETNKRVKKLALRDNNDERTFVIVGAGPSGAICAETLRQEGFTGRVVLVGDEPYLPYDRIKVTKAMNVTVDKLLIRDQTYYDTNSIETMIGVKATELVPSTKEVVLSNGYRIKYDKVFVATGSSARKIDIPGADLKNVCVARNVDDAAFIQSQLNKDKHVVVLGVSFIGLEAAAYCVDKVASVTVIGRDNVPLKPVFGATIGGRIQKFLESKGIVFKMNNGLKKCISDDAGNLNSVELNDGEILKADLCVMGVGSTLNTEFLKNSGININKNGSIDVNEYLQTNFEDVFAGGDIANAPVFSSNNEKVTIGHYGLAQYHGRMAAFNMVGKTKALKAVPFFWTTLFGVSFRYSGHGKAVDSMIVGDLEKMDYTAYFFDNNDKVIAISSCGPTPGPIVASWAEFTTQGKTIYRKDLESDANAWLKQINN
ncbi:apoptosis-inducing factor 3 isoform X2 [Culicoides brevitarsis]|uniref:apoptosis-inducing factor 3 isoform X2 n=2 Tax=Culicoides brevitarsis TaxID=469753 RepID=UPI00307C9FED